MSEQVVNRTLELYLELVEEFEQVEDMYKEKGQFEFEIRAIFSNRGTGIMLDLVHRIPNKDGKEAYASVTLNNEQAFEFLALFNRTLHEKYGCQLDVNYEPRESLEFLTTNYFFPKEL